MGAVLWAIAAGLVAGLAAATPWLVYAQRVVPSLVRAEARPPAYLVAAIPAVLATVAAFARLGGISTGSIRDDVVLIAAMIGLACSWSPIVRGAIYVTGGPRELRDSAGPIATDATDAESGPGRARTLGLVMSVSLFLGVTMWFVAPASRSLAACLDAEQILRDADPPPANIAPIEDALSYNQPEPGAQYLHSSR